MKVVVDLSLTSAARRPRQGWQPAALFHGVEQGGWFVPIPGKTPFSDPGGTSVAQFGDYVALMKDRSGNGAHAVQTTASARPILGRVPATRRRNLLRTTETLNGWSKYAVVVAPEAGGVVRVTPDATSAQHMVVLNDFTTWADNEDCICAVELKVTDPGAFRFVRFYSRTKDINFPGVYVDLTTGARTESGGPVASTATDMGDGWWRVTLTSNAGIGTMTPQLGIVASTGNTYPDTTFTGDGSAALLMRKPQAERGLAATAYQRVGTRYDVTETGVRSLDYLYRDGVDDVLAATLPDLGTAATVAFASDQGVTILTGQTIGAGAFDVLRDEMLFGMVVIDRALSEAETARLAAWLTARAGGHA